MFIDVSNWQASLDFSILKPAGWFGVIAKASEGVDFIDPTFSQFRAKAKIEGLVFGSYHYARPDTNISTADIRTISQDARREADSYLAAASPQEGELIALDLEQASPLSASQMEHWTATWLDRVEAMLGQPPMLYTYPSYWSTELGNSNQFGAYPLWLASWGTNDGTRTPANPLSGWSVIALHQYTSKGTITGYSGNLDFNWLNPAIDVVTLQLGQQPTTTGDPYGAPYTLSSGGTVIATAAARSQVFTDGVYNELHKRGKVTLDGTRKTG